MDRPDVTSRANVLNPHAPAAPFPSSPITSTSPSTSTLVRNILSSGASSVSSNYERRVHREDSFFKTYASLTDTEAVSTAHMVWNAINLPDLREAAHPQAPPHLLRPITASSLAIRKG